jgi:peroxiredoxin
MKSNTILAILLLFVFSASIGSNLFAGEPGDKVEDFTLQNYDGSSYNLSALKDSKATVIMFWSCTCPNVQPYNDRIGDFVKEYQSKGITFLAINSNSTETAEDVSAHAVKNNYPFPVLKDINNVVSDKIGATRTPEVYVISADRTILYHGRISDSKFKEQETSLDLKNALDDILAGKEVAVKTTKSFGCSIKRIQDK